MGDYKDDMSGEKKPASILPEGLRDVRIIEMIKGVSKAGNNQFVATIEDIKTRESIPVWLVAEKGKRWLLKSLLESIQANKTATGEFDWSIADVLGKVVTANVKHYKEEWINKKGETVLLDKCKISEFLLANKETEQVNGKDVAWEE